MYTRVEVGRTWVESKCRADVCESVAPLTISTGRGNTRLESQVIIIRTGQARARHGLLSSNPIETNNTLKHTLGEGSERGDESLEHSRNTLRHNGLWTDVPKVLGTSCLEHVWSSLRASGGRARSSSAMALCC